MAAQRYDIAIIGADAEGLAAAACVAARGKSALVIKTGLERPGGFAPPEAPNDIWRLLDLQETGYRAKTAPRIMAAVRDGALRSLFATRADNDRALEEEEEGAAALWDDFLMRLDRAAGRGDGLGPYAADSANDLLDGYFRSEDLKTRLAGLALAPFGMAGDEPGSAFALARVHPRHWPARADRGSPSLAEALAAICRERDVARVDGVIRSVDGVPGRERVVELEAGERFRTQAVMASSSTLAMACGLAVDRSSEPLARRYGAEGFIRIILDGPAVEAGVEEGVYILADSRNELVAARSAMREGRNPDNAPLVVEIYGRTILARAPYCPVRLVDDEGARDWSGQDRQALGRQAFERIRKKLALRASAQSIEVRIDPVEGDQAIPGVVAVPDPRLPSVEGAARCALALIGHG